MGKTSRFGKEVVVNYKGSKFLFGRGYEEVGYSLYLDETEPITCEYMTGQSGNLFIDLGANVGGYTVRLGKKFRNVIAVEPNPNAARLLRAHLDLNHLHNVNLVEKAIWSSIGEATLWIPSSNKTTRSSLVQRFEGGASLGVRTVTLDSLTEGYERVDLIKVDVEGAELPMLRGARETLGKTSKLVIEVSPSTEATVREMLAPFGYEFSDLDFKVNNIKNVLAEAAL
jgi:FkbM family methyltransferase